LAKITAASHKLAEAMYKGAAAASGAPPEAAGAGAPGGASGDKGNVVDAEVVDEKK
ncbi:MAG: hypothetical protein HY884_09130, partial [Deltaproteobacteria bacterium]|nr:hypothetical protein [Deltaproteobacteria bacterium]